MVVPITFNADGREIVLLTFSVDYDESCLSFDPADDDLNPWPDSIALLIPPIFKPPLMLSFDPLDTDGEIDVQLGDISPTPATMPDGTIMEITFTVSDEENCRGETAAVRTLVQLLADNRFMPVKGWSQDGSVRIADNY